MGLVAYDSSDEDEDVQVETPTVVRTLGLFSENQYPWSIADNYPQPPATGDKKSSHSSQNDAGTTTFPPK